MTLFFEINIIANNFSDLSRSLIKKSDDEDSILRRIDEAGRNNPRPFNDWFEGKERVYLPFKGPSENYSQEDDKEIIEVLKKNYPDKCNEIDFIQGYCINNKNKVKIGKLLNKLQNEKIKEISNKIKDFENSYSEDSPIIFNPEYMALKKEEEVIQKYWEDIIKKFTSSATRSNVKSGGGYKIVISQNPRDIAFMSTGRDWGSCMTLPLYGERGGVHHKDVFCEVESGGFIAYLVHEYDEDVEEPLARILIRRFTNQEGTSIAVLENSIYGNNMTGFAETVQKWVDTKQGKVRPGIYNRQGGEYSDTFGNSLFTSGLALAPDEEDELIGWIETPENYGAITTYWEVVDNLLIDLEDEFEDGFLSHIETNHEPRTTFYDLAEAGNYLKIIEFQESNYYIREAIELACENEFEQMYGPYGEEPMDRYEFEEAIASDEYLKSCYYGEYLDESYERFSIEEGSIDITHNMQKSVIDKVLDNPENYKNPRLINAIKNTLFDKDKIPDVPLQKKFIKEFGKDHPDLAELTINQSGSNKLEVLSESYKNLSPGPEKDRIGDIIKNEIRDVISSPEWAESIMEGLLSYNTINNVLRRLDLLNAFSPIPADLVQDVLEFIKLVDQSPTNGKFKKMIKSNLLHNFSMTNTDVPDVQNFYQSLLPNLLLFPEQKGYSYQLQQENQIFNIEQVAFALARLGENGKQFLPFLRSKAQEVINNEEASEEHKKKILKKIYYAIDSIESGQGYSTRYSFS